jgi:hypothetical protein
MKTTREILFEAAELIRARGLAKRVSQNSAGQCCAYGAIGVATTGDAFCGADKAMGATAALSAALHDLHLGGSVVGWNDNRYRTAEEVATVLEYAASVHACPPIPNGLPASVNPVGLCCSRIGAKWSSYQSSRSPCGRSL